MKQKTVFLDRDGTLIEEVNYLHRVEDLHFFSDTDTAVELLKENGFLIIVVTNQSGIGREIFEENAMHSIHEEIQKKLEGKIDAFYFCPHLPDAGCLCRKPNPGMIEKARENFEIDFENSWMVGDKTIDVETGFKAKMKTALVLTGYGQNAVKELTGNPTLLPKICLKQFAGFSILTSIFARFNVNLAMPLEKIQFSRRDLPKLSVTLNF